MTIASGTWGDNVTWRLEDDGILYVEGTGAMKDNTYSTTYMPWYSYLSQILGVVISEGITHIGHGMFYNHTAITSVTFPSTLESIGGDLNSSIGAFYGCTGLTELVFPDSLISIGIYDFYGCTGLSSIDLKNVATVGNYAFANCTSLVSVEMNGIQTISEYAFTGCTILDAIILGTNLTSIEKNAFTRYWKSNPSSSDIVKRTFTFLGPKPTFGSYAVGY